MKLHQQLSLRGKLTCVIMLTSIVTMLLAGATMLVYDANAVRQQMVRNLAVLSRMMAEDCEASLLFNDAASADRVLATLTADPMIEHAVLFRASGVPFARYESPQGCTGHQPPDLSHDGPRFDAHHLVVTSDVVVDGATIGRVVVVSGLQELHARRMNYLLVAGLVLLLACIAGYFLARIIEPMVVKPILRLARIAGTVAARQDFSIRAPEEGKDEVASTARAFNDMLVHIEKRDLALREVRTELESNVAQLKAEAEERRRTEEALHRSEEQLRQAQKMEAVGRLAGGIAHDFNNLLTVIRGQSELLGRRVAPDSPNRRSVAEILKAAERAARLTRQLLAFSRKQILQPKVLDVGNIVNELGTMLKRMIGEDIELVIRVPEDVGRVRIDPGQLEQVIMNLVVNARDSMPDGGWLVLEASNVRQVATARSGEDEILAGEYVALEVTDCGCGMEPDVLARVFEPFFTTKPMGKGTGLGLSMVYGIVRQSDGYITVRSEPGMGTTFRILLPRVDSEQVVTAEPAASRGTQRGQGETILVIEDEPLVLGLVADTLREAGYNVLSARDGPAALRICTTQGDDIRLVLTDMIMPGMNGREIARELEQLRPGVPVLYMSGYSDTGIVHDGRLDDGLMFLQKPFSPDELLERICDLLDRGSSGHAAA